MYKCTDCGQEFETKPDYCDCGNNVFENLTFAIENQEAKIQDLPKKEQKSAYVKKYDLMKDLPSFLFFLACLILSILSWMYLGNDFYTEETLSNDNITQEKIQQKIPSINEIWNDELPQNKEEKKQIVQVPINEPVQLNRTVKSPSPVKPVPNKTVLQPKQEVQPIRPTKLPKVQPKSPIKLSSTQNNSQNTKINQAQPKKEQNSKQPSQTQTSPVSSSTQQPKSQVEASQNKTVQSQTNNQTQKNLYSYKIGLRNAIASRINFLKVIGDGACAVRFKINSHGQLVERKFSVQSENDSLNDVVYSAMMSTPAYTPPPYGYNGEYMLLTVKIYGGNFTITLN